MTILLVILKLIGWLLLFFAGLFLSLLALVLFLPISYHIWVSGEPEREPKFSYRVKIFGFQIVPKKVSVPKKQHQKRQKKTEQKAAEQETVVLSEKNDEHLSHDSNEKTTENKKPEKSSLENKGAVPEKAQANKQVRQASKTNAQKTAKSETKNTVEKKGLAYKKKQLRRIRQELTDERNQRALTHVLQESRYLLRHFRPRQICADADFSLGDPANTGYATAALSVFPVIYGKKCFIYPDFETETFYLKGWIEVHGHVRVIHAVCSGLRLFFDKDIRAIIKKFH